MTQRLAKFSAALALAGACVLPACAVFDSGPREFVVQVDSVQAPGAVSGGAPFDIRFYGFVGPSGCYRFKAFRVEKTPSQADVMVLGEHEEGLCTQALVFLDGEVLTIQPFVTDPFTLRVHQPDGTVLTRTIRAE
jgi:hypothetical protein